MLRRLKVHRYRNVAPGTELHFSEGHHVLLGPNGGGKTTLLTLITVVLRGDFRDLGDEEFDLEYELVHQGASLLLRVDRTRHQSGAQQNPWQWGCRGHLEVSNGRVELQADSERTTIDGAASRIRIEVGAPDFHRQVQMALSWTPLRRQVPSIGADAAFRFDEALGVFAFMLGGPSLGNGEPLQLTLMRSGSANAQGGRFHIFFRRLYERCIDEWGQLDDPDKLQFSLSELGELAAAVDLLGMKAGTFRAELGRNERHGDWVHFTYERFQFRFTRRDGTYIIDQHLSFGQKRLLAFLFYAWANPGPIVADELVDGMHHRWIEHCLKAIGDRQAFLSSQSPLLMDFFGFDSAEAVRKCFVLCDLEVQGDRELMRWRAMTPEEADQFFDAYQVGIQYVSEILRDRGLW